MTLLMTNQPKWVCIANLGDANPVDYGGAFVFVDQTGVYPPEMEIWLEPTDDMKEGEKWWEIHRFILEKCYYTRGVLSDNKFHKNMPVWFAGTLEEAEDGDALIGDICSDDSLRRASAYLYLVGEVGAYQLSGDPCGERVTRRSEAKRITDGYLRQIEKAPKQ